MFLRVNLFYAVDRKYHFCNIRAIFNSCTSFMIEKDFSIYSRKLCIKRLQLGTIKLYVNYELLLWLSQRLQLLQKLLGGKYAQRVTTPWARFRQRATSKFTRKVLGCDVWESAVIYVSEICTGWSRKDGTADLWLLHRKE